MATIEAKEILSYMGLPESEIDSLDKFQEKFNASFIRKDIEIIKGDKIYGQVIGSMLGGTYNAMKRALKKANVDFTDEDFPTKDGRIEKVAEALIERTANKYADEIKTLKESAGKGNDEKLTELEKLVAAEKANAEALKLAKETLEGEFSTYKTTKETEIKTSRLNSEKDKLWNGFKFANTADDLKREGFQSRMDKKYKLDFDDKGEFGIFTPDGKKIPNPKKADTFKAPEEVLQEEGIAAGVYAISGHDGTKKQTTTTTNKTTTSDTAPPADVRRRNDTSLRQATAK